MTKSYLKKGLVLLSSVTLVIVFLLYRGGSFDKTDTAYLSTAQINPNGGVINQVIKDTPKIKKDSLSFLLMASSKSMVLAQTGPVITDTSQKKKPLLPKTETSMFSSSKSSIIFTPGQKIKFNIDSFLLHPDATKSKKRRK